MQVASTPRVRFALLEHAHEQRAGAEILDDEPQGCEGPGLREYPVGLLPYGVRKRIELGRALCMKPKLLLLDEPAAGLNRAEVRRFLQLIQDIRSAQKIGIHGGSAFRAIAGFGRHGVLHEQHFFELAGEQTVEVEFIVNDEEAQKLLDLLRAEQLRLFYARVPAEFGVVG